MQASVKAKRPPKRDLFSELSEDMGALGQAREGKRTLRTHAVEFRPT
jgi:putative transcriptional regulator